MAERKNIDAIDFSVLSFLAAGPHSSKELKDLLGQFTQLELSKAPFARRLRELVKEGYVEEETKGNGFPSVYSITKTGKSFCVDWANSFMVLSNLARYVLDEKPGDWRYERK